MHIDLKMNGKPWFSGIFLCILALVSTMASLSSAEVHHHTFLIEENPVMRLCETHNKITVNKQYPGPNLIVRNGDSLVIKVLNRVGYNITIHWHGVRQMRNPWADGPEYITQCPIQPGESYTYNFTIEGQEGTLWWHAHSGWFRDTVYGALIILPKLGFPYPFPNPMHEIPILLGSWWDKCIVDIMKEVEYSGCAPNVSDAFTINSQPGGLCRCSSNGTFKISVNYGDTILLRVINGALNQNLFFTVADHQLTVVGVDASYTKPFNISVIMLGPGQTTNVLITANQPKVGGRYYLAATTYCPAKNTPYDNTTATAILEYQNDAASSSLPPVMPPLPAHNDTNAATEFQTRLRSLGGPDLKVPIQIDESLFFTVGYGVFKCDSSGPNCKGPNSTRFTCSMNNISFVFPKKSSLLQAYYNNISGIFTLDFPKVPPVEFNYTGKHFPEILDQPIYGTRMYRLKYGSNVEIVLQDTSISGKDDHPIHLHGYHFYIVGEGFGNFNPQKDPLRFNLFDPPLRNTVAVPVGGWAVIRFVADNPGVWIFHCHIDYHTTWGLAMAFLVENGVGESQSIIPPPPDLPPCDISSQIHQSLGVPHPFSSVI